MMRTTRKVAKQLYECFNEDATLVNTEIFGDMRSSLKEMAAQKEISGKLESSAMLFALMLAREFDRGLRETNAILAEILMDMRSSLKEMAATRREMVATRREMVATRREMVATRREMAATRREMVATRKEMSATRKGISKLDE